jgi:hypothetical protein
MSKMNVRSNCGKFSLSCAILTRSAQMVVMEEHALQWPALAAAFIISITRTNLSFWFSKMWPSTKTLSSTVGPARILVTAAKISILKIRSFCTSFRGLKTKWCATYSSTSSLLRQTATSGTCFGLVVPVNLTSTKV